jgi:eukaryotic-like serine/threonine-protein kinase
MGRKTPSQEVDPLYLPLGTRVGPWRVTGFRGRGAYGILYRVEHVKRQPAGPFALKLAIYPRDPRFENEVQLLSIIDSPHVPQLMDYGVWEHSSGDYPYLVMQLVDGTPLYDWAARRNPSEAQVVRLLAQVARGLGLPHGLWRRALPRCCHAHLQAASPGTPAYRSPESLAFVRAFRRHPTAHYPASTCDDLFALGVMAYRLVTDVYPPSPHLEEPGSEVWREGGPGPRQARELNPQMSPELDALISRLLALAPEERFNGEARLVAEALEQLARRANSLAGSRVFVWGYDHLPCVRSPEAAQLSAQRDAAARQELERREAEQKAGAAKALEQRRLSAFAPAWASAGVAAFLILVLALVTVKVPRGEQQSSTSMGFRKERSIAVGDNAMSSANSTSGPESQGDSTPRLARPLPEKPFPGQLQPPCSPRIETVLRGACWVEISAKPPCGNVAYEWEGKCYMPSMPQGRQPTSNPSK